MADPDVPVPARPGELPDDGADDEVADAELVDDGVGAGGADDLLGGLGGLDMGSLLGTAMQMQQQMLEAQAEAAATEVEGQSGGGVVKIRVTGGFEFRSVEIDPAAVDPDDVEMLQDLVLAALHDAVARASEVAQAGVPSLGGLGLGGMPDLGGGGLDLGALFGGDLGVDDGDDEEDDDDDEDGSSGSAGAAGAAR